MTTACGPVGGLPRRLAVTGLRRAVASAAGAFCAATGPTTRPKPRTRPAASASPLMCLTDMLLSPRYMVEYSLLQALRVGVHGARPLTEQRTKTTDDVRPLRRAIVPLADVIAQVVEQQVVCIDDQLPVALTHRLLRAVRTGGRPPEERPLLFRRAALEDWKEVQPLVG